jgi:ABC-type sulfate transport system permease component
MLRITPPLLLLSRITGVVLSWIGSTIAFGDVVSL